MLGGMLPKELEALPELPPQLKYIWEWFNELCRGRTSNGFGMNPLSHVEIDAWCRLKRIELESWELDALRVIDTSYLIAHSKKG